MRCRDAKYKLTAQRENDLPQSEAPRLHEHLRHCPGCRGYERRQQHLDTLLVTATPRLYPNISTERIMRAVEQQRRITQQLQDLRAQQQARIARLGNVGPKAALVAFSILGLLSLSLLGLFLFQPDLIVAIFALLGGVIDAVLGLAEYLLAGLVLITRNNWLLSGVALVSVVMMGMWLRLMRYPQQA